MVRRYTIDEVETIRKMAEEGHPWEEIAEKLSRTTLGVKTKASKLGIKRKHELPMPKHLIPLLREAERKGVLK